MSSGYKSGAITAPLSCNGRENSMKHELSAKDWIVTLYNDRDKIIDQFEIKNRTEKEAEKEAEPEARSADDWTLTEKSEAIKMKLWKGK